MRAVVVVERLPFGEAFLEIRVAFVAQELIALLLVGAVRSLDLPCTSSNQSEPLRLCHKRHFPPLCRVRRRPQILSPSCG